MSKTTWQIELFRKSWLPLHFTIIQVNSYKLCTQSVVRLLLPTNLSELVWKPSMGRVNPRSFRVFSLSDFTYSRWCTNSIRCLNSRGQTCDQEAVVQCTFPWEKQLLFVNTQCSTSLPVLCTQLLNAHPDSCPPEVKPCLMKTIYNL